MHFGERTARVLLRTEQDGMGNRQARIARGWSVCCLGLVAVLAGCSSAQRRHCLRLYSIAVEPAAATNDELATAFGLDDNAEPAQTVSAAQTEQ